MNRFKGFAIPYFIWLIVLAFLPIVVMIAFTFLSMNGSSLEGASFSFEAYNRLIDPSIAKLIWNSLIVAFWTVFFCVLIGYPCAYFVSFSKLKNKLLILLLLILPMWSNSMLRIVSWLRLFTSKYFVGFNLAGSMEAVIFVSVTTYLPFMIFPIYTILEKLDRGLIEASNDLGVPKFKTFLKVTLPLSISGVYSGIIMVFLPAATGFAISQTIGLGKIRLIGNLLQSVFEKNNYNFGSLISVLVSLVITLVILLFSKFNKEKKPC